MLVKVSLAASLLFVGLATTRVDAAPATCRDYSESQGANRALIDGFITGFVTARLEGRPDEVDATTLKVRDLATRFCIIHPDERVVDVIGGLGDIVTGYVKSR